MVAATHRVRFDLRVAASHRSRFHARVAANHRSPITWKLNAGHRSRFSLVVPIAAGHRSRFSMTAPVAAGHRARFDLLADNPISARHRSRFTLLAPTASIIITGTPALSKNGRPIDLLGADLAIDEGDYAWRATLTIAKLEDYLDLAVDDALMLDWYGEAFALIVDAREHDRDAPANRRLRITAVSPTVNLASPRATRIDKVWDSAISARAAAEEILGQTVAWSLPDWTIPAWRLGASAGIPVELARRIVEAAGGILESDIDGTWKARPRYPVHIPDMATATVDHTFTAAADLFAVRESIRRRRRFDRLRILDVDTQAADRIDVEPDPIDGRRATVRAYPWPYRSGLTLRASRGDLRIASQGTTTRSETETVEIANGSARTRYPITAITAIEWLSDNLGGLAFEPYTDELRTTSGDGYSLARITYTTTAHQWQIEADDDLQAQLILEDGNAAGARPGIDIEVGRNTATTEGEPVVDPLIGSVRCV